MKGNDACCPEGKNHGYSVNGTFAEYAVAYVNYVTPIPDSLESAAAVAILCAGMTVYKALKQSNTIIGDWVAIPGAGGGLGHLACQYAAAMGLRVLAIDTGAAKKALCLKSGAEKWIDFKESGDNMVKDIVEATGGGPSAAVITAGVAAPYNLAIHYLKKTGTLVAVGMPAETEFLQIPITHMVEKGIRIVGSIVGNRQDCIEALDIVARGKVHCDYTVKSLEDINSVFADMEAGKAAGRVVLKMY
jgi:propanol-preferring alcohol dehydrogenase